MVKEYNLLIKELKALRISNPTFVSGSKKLKNLTKYIAEIFHTNPAFILKKPGPFSRRSMLVLCGHVNENAILLLDENETNYWERIDLYDLVKCAGAKNVYIKQVNHSTPIKFRQMQTHMDNSFSNRLMS